MIPTSFSFHLLYKYLNESIFYLEKMSKTGNFHSNLILRQNKLDLRAMSVENKSVNRELKQDQKAK